MIYCFICGQKELKKTIIKKCPKCSKNCCNSCLSKYYISEERDCYCSNTGKMDEYRKYLFEQDKRHYNQTFDEIELSKVENDSLNLLLLGYDYIITYNMNNLENILNNCELDDKKLIIERFNLIKDIIQNNKSKISNNLNVKYIRKCSFCDHYINNFSICIYCDQKCCDDCWIASNKHENKCSISRINYINKLINSIKPCPNCSIINIDTISTNDNIWCSQCKNSYNRLTGKEVLLNPPDIGDYLYNYKEKIEEINNYDLNKIKSLIFYTKNKLKIEVNKSRKNSKILTFNQFITQVNLELSSHNIPDELRNSLNIKQIDNNINTLTDSMNDLDINLINISILLNRFKELNEFVNNLIYIIYDTNNLINKISLQEYTINTNINTITKKYNKNDSKKYTILEFDKNQLAKLYDNTSELHNSIKLLTKSYNLDELNELKKLTEIDDELVKLIEVPNMFKLIESESDDQYKLDDDIVINLTNQLIKIMNIINDLINKILKICKQIPILFNIILLYGNQILKSVKLSNRLNIFINLLEECIQLNVNLYEFGIMIYKMFNILNHIKLPKINNELIEIENNIIKIINEINNVTNNKKSKQIIRVNTILKFNILIDQINESNNRPKFDTSALYIKYNYINTSISGLIIEQIKQNISNNSGVINYVKGLIKHIRNIYNYNLKNTFDCLKYKTLSYNRETYLSSNNKNKKVYISSLYKNNRKEICEKMIIDVNLVSVNMCQYLLYQNNWKDLNSFYIFISEIQSILDHTNRTIINLSKFHNQPCMVIDNTSLDYKKLFKKFNYNRIHYD